VGGLVDLIEEGVSGYLVPVNDPAALANRIIEIFQNTIQAKMMADQARSNIEKYFSAQIMAQKTLQTYEQYSRR